MTLKYGFLMAYRRQTVSLLDYEARKYSKIHAILYQTVRLSALKEMVEQVGG